jgi:uncharacterized RDD family membrane protein YckC
MPAYTYASYGKRFVAALIDFCLTWVAAMVLFIVAFGLLFSDSIRVLAILLMILSVLWIPAMIIYNSVIRQGKSGQTIGKSRMRIRLIKEETGAPIGVGYAFLRGLASYALNSITGGIFWIVDVLFPAFDSKNQRVIDKMLQTVVITEDQNAASTTQSGVLPSRDYV